MVLIGDSAHMASPRTAAGAHTGILDAAGLYKELSSYQCKDNVDAAIKAYESGGERRAAEALAMTSTNGETSRSFKMLDSAMQSKSIPWPIQQM